MGRLNDFLIRKLSERKFDPEQVNFEELEQEVDDTLESWNLDFDSPRRINYHDGVLYNPEESPYQAEFKPWLDRIDVSLRQQFGEEDLKLALFEEKIHKAQFDYFLGHPGEEFDSLAEELENNFQEYWERIENEVEGALLGSARERTIEGKQDMLIASLPQIGINYDEILDEAQGSHLYRVAKPRVLKNTLRNKIDENEEELTDVAQPMINRFENYQDVYHVNPVAEAFTDIVESHLTGSVGSKVRKWQQVEKSKQYQLGTSPELYSELVEEYNEFEGTPDEKISHVLSLMPQYLEDQYENGEIPERMEIEDFEIV